MVLKELLTLGEAFQKDLEAVNIEDATMTPQNHVGPAPLLKVRDPWCLNASICKHFSGIKYSVLYAGTCVYLRAYI